MDTTTDRPVPTGPQLDHEDRVTVAKLKVLADYLIVRPLAVPSKRAGSALHMPDSAGERERSHRGIVIVTGPGDYNEPGTALVPMRIEEGDLVFFGKYAGTEERIGTDVVLVMRESECRFCVPQGRYVLVTHDEPQLDHLVEDWCEVCHGVPQEELAKEQLELARVQQQLRLQEPCVCGHLGDRHAHGAASCHDCDCQAFRALIAQASAPEVEAMRVTAPVDELAEVNATLTELFRKGKLEGSFHVVTALSSEKRPCKTCHLMQRRFTTDQGPKWIGLRCGHVDEAEA